MNVRNLTAALLVASSAALAASPDTSAPTQGRRALDQSGDGTISREEAAARPRLAQSFDRLDVNKDGVLSREELRAGRPSGRHERHANLDTNGDGSISRDEAQAAPRLAGRFDAIDANKDGTLTRDELAKCRQTHPRPAPDSTSEPVKP